MKSAQYGIYKGVNAKPNNPKNYGAIQFSLKPYEQTGNYEGNNGVVFVNACSATGPNAYDWTNKFAFALGLTDIGKMLHFFVSGGSGESLSLVHDPNKGKADEGTKIRSMSIYTKDGCLNGAMITCSTKIGKEVTSHKIPISGDEIIVLKVLLEAAVPHLLGWGFAGDKGEE